MSLVNDMLRDLDARRRDAPAPGPGAEKLVPSEDYRAKKSSSPKWLIWAPMLLVAIVAIVWLLTIGRGNSAGQLPAVQIASEPVATIEAATAEETEELIAQAAAAAAAQTMAQLESRLQQLEAQNQALLEAQRQVSNPVMQSPQTAQTAMQQPLQQNVQPTMQPLVQQPPQQSIQQPMQQPPMQQPMQSQGQQVSAGVNQAWADLPAMTPEEMQASQSLASASASTPLTRSPTELNFEDRERLQVQTALQQWASGQRLTALQTLDSFTYENPTAHNARETLAKLLIQQGEPERAMQAVELGLAIAPNNTAFRKVKARVLLDTGNANDAVVLLSQNSPPVSADTEYHDVLATAYLANAQYDLATLVYRALLQSGASEGRWWYGLAASLDAQGYTQDAAQAYERALQQLNLSASLRQTSQQRLQLIRQSSAAR